MTPAVPPQPASDASGHLGPGPAALPPVKERPDREARARVTAAVVMLLARTPYLEGEMLGLRDVVGPGSVCIDVGSAAGLYTLALSRLAGPSGRVHSVEAVPFAQRVWTPVLGARRLRNVCHHAVALGAAPGSGAMSVPVSRHGPVTGRSFLAGGSTGLGSNAEFAGQVTVQVRVDTLDGLCAADGLTRLDFLKIDVEGAELRVLEGGQRAIEAFRPAMLLEIEARHTARYQYAPQDIVGWLAQRGYTMYAWQHGWQETSTVTEHTRNYLFRAPGPQQRHRPDGNSAAQPAPAPDDSPA